MQEFASAKLVITDRLHGMIFAALTQTPCIVLGNYNHKVKGTYEWLQELPYICFADTVQQAAEIVPKMLEITACDFPGAAFRNEFSEFRAFLSKL